MGRKRPRDSEEVEEPSSHDRRLVLSAALSIEENLTMPACAKCVEHGDLCYYNARKSTKCAKCIEKQRKCDGTFSLEEYRRVGEQKKRLTAEVRQKRKEIARLRSVLLDRQQEMLKAMQDLNSAENSESSLDASLAHWERVSDNMLTREMRAMGVLREQPEESEIALGEPIEEIVEQAPFVEYVDLSFLLPEVGSSEVPG